MVCIDVEVDEQGLEKRQQVGEHKGQESAKGVNFKDSDAVGLSAGEATRRVLVRPAPSACRKPFMTCFCQM